MQYDDLIIASSNNGGLSLVGRDLSVEPIDAFSTTGMLFHDGKFYRAIQKNSYLELVCYGEEGISKEFFTRVKDIHDLIMFQGKMYAVSTGSNEIFEMDETLEYTNVIRFEGEGDAWHLNCLVVIDGRLYCSAFCNDPKHYNYKGKTKENGFLVDVFTGEILIDKLSQPHSPCYYDGKIYICNSENRSLLIKEKDNTTVDEIFFENYTRGLYINNGIAYIGLSKSRNIEAKEESSRVIVYDLKAKQVLEEISIPFDEIYEIKPVNEPFTSIVRRYEYRPPSVNPAKIKLKLQKLLKLKFK